MGLTVTVAAANFNLTQLATVKDVLGITDTTLDSVLTGLITRASAAIATYCNRVFAKQTYQESLSGSGGPMIMMSMTPVLSVSEVQESGTVIIATDYNIDDKYAGFIFRRSGWIWYTTAHKALDHYPVAGGETPDYKITYIAGFKLPGETPGAGDIALPGDIEEAAIEAVRDWLIRRKTSSDVQSKTVGNLSITYKQQQQESESVPGELMLPAKSRALLRRWQKEGGAQA